MTFLPPRQSLLAPGFELDRYQLLCPIAKGGMASAWVARLRGKYGFEKIVAIKTILPQFIDDAKFKRMFLDEARFASRIAHTNVAQVLDLGEEHGILYLVMEWVDGESLLKLHRAATEKDSLLPIGILLRIVADACAGLHAAHELRSDEGRFLGIVHRDVSPENILVSAHGIAKIIDFGIAKAHERLTTTTKGGVIKGKVHYISPEQVLGHPIDRRADIWAVGAMLYRFLAGKPVYDAPCTMDSLQMLASRRPPEALPSSVPAPVRKVVASALCPRREDRYGTAREMQWAIESAMTGVGLTTTTVDVASFVALHLCDRMDERRRAIAAALEASGASPALSAILRAHDASSGSFLVGTRAMRESTELSGTEQTPTRSEIIAPRAADVKKG